MSFENFRKKDRCLVWAHRGASGYAPENTLEAFKKAVEMGADGVELDVQLTKDDQMVVIHDELIDRTSDGRGWVKDMTLEELRKYNYNKTHPEYEHADIPTLREVYELLKPTGLTINVELKTGIVFYEELERKVIELTKEMGMEDKVLYSSFNHYTCVKLHELNPEAYVGFCMQMDQSTWHHTLKSMEQMLFILLFTTYSFLIICRMQLQMGWM